MYILILSFLTTVAIFLPQNQYKRYFIIFLLFFALKPIYLVLIKFKDKMLLIISIVVYGSLLGSLLIAFRTIRDSFPPAEIENSKIVGYSQYFGYAFYLDTVLFFTLLVGPLIIVLGYKFFKKKNMR
jgi:hypothetical protein